MIVVFVVVTALVVAAIGLVAVGAVTGRLSREAPRAVFQLDEAVQEVADRLPPDVTAQLSYDDVRRLLTWYIDYLEAKGVAGESDHDLESLPSGPVVADDEEVTAYVLGRAADVGLDLDDVMVAQVLEEGEAYLRAIGAVGAAVPPPPDPGA